MKPNHSRNPSYPPGSELYYSDELYCLDDQTLCTEYKLCPCCWEAEIEEWKAKIERRQKARKPEDSHMRTGHSITMTISQASPKITVQCKCGLQDEIDASRELTNWLDAASAVLHATKATVDVSHETFDRARSVQCPKCGVGPGWRCVDPWDNPFPGVLCHKARVKAWREGLT